MSGKRTPETVWDKPVPEPATIPEHLANRYRAEGVLMALEALKGAIPSVVVVRRDRTDDAARAFRALTALYKSLAGKLEPPKAPPSSLSASRFMGDWYVWENGNRVAGPFSCVSQAQGYIDDRA